MRKCAYVQILTAPARASTSGHYIASSKKAGKNRYSWFRMFDFGFISFLCLNSCALCGWFL